MEEEKQPEYEKYLGVIVAFSGAWSFAVCSVFNRKLKEIDYTALMVYHGLIGGVLASVVILTEGIVKGGVFRFYSLEQYLILFAACCFDTVACYSMTIAY